MVEGCLTRKIQAQNPYFTSDGRHLTSTFPEISANFPREHNCWGNEHKSLGNHESLARGGRKMWSD